ncbi:alkaline phosphatase family protein [Rhizosphaericola mali]|nr:alkaline phosphatase family protein [Rhizosphaericola mali]
MMLLVLWGCYAFGQLSTHVVVIGIDGLSTAGMEQSNIPNLDSLIKNGAYITHAHTVLPSSSSPNWASMIMGAGPELHGVTDNDWELDDHSLAPIVADSLGRFPSIFDVLHQAHPKAKLASIYEWDGFGRLYNKAQLYYDRNGKDAYETEQLASACIQRSQPQFTFIHFDLVDHAGHTYGHGTSQYFDAVHIVDSLVGKICNVINKSPMSKKTMIMIVADHGGIGMGHGGNSEQEVRVPMILSGYGIKKNYLVQEQVLNYDVAPTIAYALNVQPPYVWTGRPIKAAFLWNKEPANLWLGVTKSIGPVIYPIGYLNNEPGGLYIDTTASVVIKTKGKHAIYYTLDGSEPNLSSFLYDQPFYLDTTAIVKAVYINSNGALSKSSVGDFRILNKKSSSGIRIHYYSGSGWRQVPNFEFMRPDITDTAWEFRLGEHSSGNEWIQKHNYFGARLEGQINILTNDLYTFYTKSDDGSLLYIDDELVVNNDGSHGVVEQKGNINLKKGKHKIRIDYINNEGGYWLQAYYKCSSVEKQIIPANVLSQP